MLFIAENPAPAGALAGTASVAVFGFSRETEPIALTDGLIVVHAVMEAKAFRELQARDPGKLLGQFEA